MLKKMFFLSTFLLSCINPNPYEDLKKENNKINGTIYSFSSKVYVSIVRPQTTPSFNGAKSNVLAQTTTTSGDFSLPKIDCQDCYITAHTESNNTITAMAQIPLNKFNGTITLTYLNLSKTKAAPIGRAAVKLLQSYIIGATIEFLDEKWISNFDFCPDKPFWMPGPDLTYHLFTCKNYADTDVSELNNPAVPTNISTPKVSVSPNIGYITKNTTLLEPGTGFNPNCSITLYFVPEDKSFREPIQLTTDKNGNYSWQYTVNPGTAIGTWSYYAIDSKGARSSTITFQIKP
jgi:hypothetical protein